MLKTSRYGVFLSFLLLAAWGCQDAPDNGNSHKQAKGHDHAHAHAEKGPNGGQIIELGKDHKYHAELLHDDAKGQVTVHLLGEEKDGKFDRLAIDSQEIHINVRHGKKAHQFKLAAQPVKADGPGLASRFVSIDKTLCKLLDEDGAEPQLSVHINGRTYIGRFAHDHDHAHGDHDAKHHHDHDK